MEKNTTAKVPAALATTRPRVFALVHARDKADALPRALAFLRHQTWVPDSVVVIADNCTDSTADVAQSFGVEVVRTRNAEGKAAALNLVLAELLPWLSGRDLVLVLDADTVLDPGYLEAAASRLEQCPDAGGLGSDSPEHQPLPRARGRKREQTAALTGTAGLFRATVLQEVAAARGRHLPGVPGTVYDTVAHALAEDDEITRAVAKIGYSMVSLEGHRPSSVPVLGPGRLPRSRIVVQLPSRTEFVT